MTKIFWQCTSLVKIIFIGSIISCNRYTYQLSKNNKNLEFNSRKLKLHIKSWLLQVLSNITAYLYRKYVDLINLPSFGDKFRKMSKSKLEQAKREKTLSSYIFLHCMDGYLQAFTDKLVQILHFQNIDNHKLVRKL